MGCCLQMLLLLLLLLFDNRNVLTYNLFIYLYGVSDCCSVESNARYCLNICLTMFSCAAAVAVASSAPNCYLAMFLSIKHYYFVRFHVSSIFIRLMVIS